MFVSVAVPNQEAILDFDRPAIPLLISEPILFQQTAQRAWMIIHAHYAASIDCGRFIWDAPLGQPATLRELNPATAPGMRNDILDRRGCTPRDPNRASWTQTDLDFCWLPCCCHGQFARDVDFKQIPKRRQVEGLLQNVLACDPII
jgi:hypothetical protein